MSVVWRILAFIVTVARAWWERFLLAKGGKKAAWGCLPLIGLCVFCGMVQAAGQQAGLIAIAPTGTPRPTATLRPTDAPQPTDVPLPTATPAPTAAPEPTATAAPTSAPEPTAIIVPTVAIEPTVVATGLSEEARAYFGAAAGPIGEYGRWLGALGEQSTKAGEDISLIADETWVLQTAVAITGLRDAASKLDALDASGTEAEEIGRLVQQIVDETAPMTDEYTAGVDNRDPSQLTSAATRMRTIAGLIEQMNVEMQGLQP